MPVSHTANDVLQNTGTDPVHADRYRHPVVNPVGLSLRKRHMDVPCGDDHTVIDGDLPGGTRQPDAGRPRQLAGHTDGNILQSKPENIRKRKLHLCLCTRRAKDAHLFNFSFRSDHRQTFRGRELSRLRELFIRSKRMTGAEEPLDIRR